MEKAGQESHRAEIAARLAHELNRHFCESVGDFSQPTWREAPEWQRKSAIDGVHNALHRGEISPEESHENWMRAKIEDGWTYGPTKDPEGKTHPCMVSYSELPEEQKIKDRLFLSVVSALFPESVSVRSTSVDEKTTVA